MAQARLPRARKALTTPRAAAVAGIIFATLYGTILVMIRSAIPADITTDSATWLESSASTVSFALNLVPYAGIAFLWFIGVIRDRVGEMEDRFFATVFLGSGLMFLALTFMGAALAGGLVTSSKVSSTNLVESGVFLYGRAVMFQTINTYAIRMAAVFMISLGTIWIRTGLMHRYWAILTYTLALVLLVTISFSLWVILIFPGWVLAVSIYFLIVTLRQAPKATITEESVEGSA